jgi:hypothetical protein
MAIIQRIQCVYLYIYIQSKTHHHHHEHELNIIHNILHNNSSPIKPHTPKPAQPTDPKTPQKWASFTYVGKETSYITNIFRQTDLKIAFRTKNNIGNLLTHKNSPDRQTDIYSRSGIYKLSCPDCNKAYVGQTGRKFSMRYREHKTAFRNNNQAYSFAKHLNDSTHFFSPINDIMQILHCHRKGPHLNTMERFHIHTEATDNNHLNDDHTIFPNAIFDTLLRTNHP